MISVMQSQRILNSSNSVDKKLSKSEVNELLWNKNQSSNFNLGIESKEGRFP